MVCLTWILGLCVVFHIGKSFSLKPKTQDQRQGGCWKSSFTLMMKVGFSLQVLVPKLNTREALPKLYFRNRYLK